MNKLSRHEIFIFITNEDKNEYKRYTLCADAESVIRDSLNDGGSPLEFKWCKDEQACCTNVVLKAQEWKSAVSEKLGCLGDSFISAPQCKEVTGILDTDQADLSDGEKIVYDLDERVRRLEKACEKIDANFKEADITLFIHWGGGNDRTIERKERKFTNFLRSTISHYEHRVRWQVFSVSSLRKEIFDVTVARIKIPNDVRLLRESFEVANKFSSIKDALSQYVVARGVIKEQDKRKINEFFASDFFRSKLRCVAMKSNVKWVMKWDLFKSLMDAKSIENAKRIADKILWSKNKDAQSHARAFIAQLFTDKIVEAIEGAVE